MSLNIQNFLFSSFITAINKIEFGNITLLHPLQQSRSQFSRFIADTLNILLQSRCPQPQRNLILSIIISKEFFDTCPVNED